jgi:hypothetical protein
VLVLEQFRNNIGFLNGIRWVILDDNSIAFRKHILQGEVVLNANNNVIKKGGFHYIPDGLSEIHNGKIVQIVDGPDQRGYYKAFVELKDINGNWHKKSFTVNLIEHYEFTDMFPAHWTERELLENIALAYNNKKFFEGNKYIGKMSDGKEVVLCLDLNTGRIITAWPN